MKIVGSSILTFSIIFHLIHRRTFFDADYFLKRRNFRRNYLLNNEGGKPVLSLCLFQDEMSMNVHANYSQSNCLLECAMDYAISAVRIFGYSN